MNSFDDGMATVTEPHEHLPRLHEYVAKWATAEILRGLLAHPHLVNALRQGAADTELCRLTGASRRQMRSLLQALEVEDLVSETDDGWHFTEFGEAAAGDLAGWLELSLCGYGEFIRHAEALWRGKPDQGWRDMRSVGTASVSISRHGALPLVARLIRKHRPAARLVVDVGCADATYIAELCEAAPELRGVGVEPDEHLRQEAKELLSRRGLEGRVQLAESIEAIGLQDLDPDVLVFGFSLHEIVEQQGRPAVIALLRQIGELHPGSVIIVVEVDYTARAEVQRMRSDAYLRGYYNIYYMLHDFTNQTLLTRPQWRDLFTEAGFAVLDEQAIDPKYDTTGLEFASVLARAGLPAAAAV